MVKDSFCLSFSLDCNLLKSLNLLKTWKQAITVWTTISFALAFGLFFFKKPYARPNFTTDLTALYGQLEEYSKTGELPPDPAARVVVFATLVNCGNAASIARGFTLSAEMSGQTYVGHSTMLGKMVFYPRRIRGRVTFSEGNALYNRALVPVVPGGSVEGILIFRFPDLSQRALTTRMDGSYPSPGRPGMKLTLGFRDAFRTFIFYFNGFILAQLFPEDRLFGDVIPPCQ